MGQNSVQVQVQPEGKKEGIPEEATPRGALKNGREFDWRSRGRAVQAERTADQRLPTEGSAWPPAAPASHPLRPLCVLGSLRLPTPGRLCVPRPLRLERTRDHTASDPAIGNSDSAFKVSKRRKIRV